MRLNLHIDWITHQYIMTFPMLLLHTFSGRRPVRTRGFDVDIVVLTESWQYSWIGGIGVDSRPFGEWLDRWFVLWWWCRRFLDRRRLYLTQIVRLRRCLVRVLLRLPLFAFLITINYQLRLRLGWYSESPYIPIISNRSTYVFQYGISILTCVINIIFSCLVNLNGHFFDTE